MSTEQKISTVIRTQLPDFITDEYETFIQFIELYYRYLEQSSNILEAGKVIERIKNLQYYQDIDKTIDDFLPIFYKSFLQGIPSRVVSDKRFLIKHILDFYRSKGTEKSYRFLLKILTGIQNLDFYYPRQDILKLSDGKWYIQKTLRLLHVTKDDVETDVDDTETIKEFIGTLVTGETSGAEAIIDKGEKFYEGGVLIEEITVSSVSGTFLGGETVSTTYTNSIGEQHTLTGIVQSGIIYKIRVINPGSGYSIGDPVVIEHPYGSGGYAEVSSITDGNVQNISVISGGAGFRVADFALFSASVGSGANAYVSLVDTSETVHPNTYNIVSSIIDLEANTAIGNTTYTNLSSSNANTTIANAMSYFTFSNTGPILVMTVSQAGSGYTSVPDIDVIANTRVRSLGIVGRIDIVSGGHDYAIGDELIFDQPLGGHGTGLKANVSSIGGNGGITGVRLRSMGGRTIGGTGYSMNFLPRITVNTAAGAGANLIVSAILGDGESLSPSVTTIGQILEIRVISGGNGYNTAPNINLTAIGDGTATANARVLVGLYTYPGRYINDDGMLSSYNFIQDQDFYQNFSYVMRSRESLPGYGRAVKTLLHPVGTKLFGERLIESSNTTNIHIIDSVSSNGVYQDNNYTPNVITFDGASYFTKDFSGFQNLTIGNSSTGFASVWFRVDSMPSDGTEMRLLSINTVSWLSIQNNQTAFANGSGSYINFRMATASNTTAVQITSDGDGAGLRANEWYHMAIGYDTNDANKSRIYLNYANATKTATVTGTLVDYSANIVTIGAKTNGGSPFIGDMAEFAFGNSYINVATSLNIFTQNSHYLPANLISTLRSNSSFRGVIFRSDAAHANDNWGTAGGQFTTITGTFTDSTRNPATDDIISE